MDPTLVREPFHRKGWVYEEKVDGWRIVAYKDGARVRLVSRNGRDHTGRFHQIAAAVSKLRARALVLDGEVAIFDQQRFPTATGVPGAHPVAKHGSASLQSTFSGGRSGCRSSR